MNQVISLAPTGKSTSGRNVSSRLCIERLALTHRVTLLDATRNPGSVVSAALSYARTAAAMIRKRGSLYYAFPDGAELLVAIPLLATARITRTNTVVHHHSRRYLDSPGFLSRLAFLASKTERFLHVCQCQKLSDETTAIYSVARCAAMSNAVFVNPSADLAATSPNNPPRVGYFGTISEEKGFGVFIESAETLKETREIVAPVAGRCESDSRGRLEEFSDRHEWSEVSGPLFARDKDEFLAALDVLVFPTIYRTETEGIVILEALAAATPVVATAVGCIESVVGDSGGICVDNPTANRVRQSIEAVLDSEDLDPAGRFAAVKAEAEAAFSLISGHLG